MAKVKSAATTSAQKGNVPGKRRGIKRNHGQFVNPGTIIVRQLGTKYVPGINTKLARNYDIIARVAGIVQFKKIVRNRKIKTQVNVIPIKNKE